MLLLNCVTTAEVSVLCNKFYASYTVRILITCLPDAVVTVMKLCSLKLFLVLMKHLKLFSCLFILSIAKLSEFPLHLRLTSGLFP
jgi:hypothetical protein